jgi:predicted AlkP superfamily phosphohydrolase/phosphomutase
MEFTKKLPLTYRNLETLFNGNLIKCGLRILHMVHTLVIGLDGATWDVLTPLIQKGELPTFKNLMDTSLHGPLTSTIPPVTGPSWVSVATGRTPGKTGIIDFINRKDSSSRLFPVNASDFKGISFWDYISSRDYKVGIVNFPMLWPPYPVNGFMISGLHLLPSDSITYPGSLREEIDRITGGYETTVDYHLEKYNDEDLLFHDIMRVLDKRAKTANYLMENYPVDLFIAIFSCTDWIQHAFWKYFDESHPDYEENSPHMQDFVIFWKKIDEIVGSMIAKAGPDATVIILSDHGFGPNDQCFNLARWLHEKNYMVIREGEPESWNTALEKTKNRLNRGPGTLIIKGGRLLLRGIRGLKRKINPLWGHGHSLVFTGLNIDFEASRAYCLGHTIPFGAIYIPEGEHHEETEKKIIHDLNRLGEEIGKDVTVEIFLPENLFEGPKIRGLPDILFSINNWRCVITETDIKKPLFIERPYSERHSGSHRMNGILAACGPHIKKGTVHASVYDIAPTILSLFGIPVFGDMDGTVLSQIATQKVQSLGEEPHTDHEKEKILENVTRLKREDKL